MTINPSTESDFPRSPFPRVKDSPLGPTSRPVKFLSHRPLGMRLPTLGLVAWLPDPPRDPSRLAGGRCTRLFSVLDSLPDQDSRSRTSSSKAFFRRRNSVSLGPLAPPDVSPPKGRTRTKYIHTRPPPRASPNSCQRCPNSARSPPSRPVPSLAPPRRWPRYIRYHGPRLEIARIARPIPCQLYISYFYV